MASSKSLADFKQMCLLGEGAYSAVYKVLRLADREIYALKKVKLPSLSDKEKSNALNEVRLLASIQHENIIAYKEAFFDDKTRCLCIVTEYADSGDLFQQITKCTKERVHPKEADVWRYLSGMCHGLKALHDMRILHRDLKCANVFLSLNGSEIIAKLGDFNVSKVAKRGLCMTQTGTPYYASPEVWRDMPYDAKSDMWSLGCVLYEMVALRPPFRAEDMEGLYRKVLRGQYPRIPPHFSNDLGEVIGVLLQVNPRHRPSIDQLLQMPVMRRRQPTAAEPEQRQVDLLSTIKLPKNAIDLSGCLPGPQYEVPIGFHHYGAGVPPSQESAGDIAGGTAKLPPSMSRRGQPALPSQSEDDGPPRRGADYQDSLDAYISSPAPPSQAGPSHPSHRVAPPLGPPVSQVQQEHRAYPGNQGHQGHQGAPASSAVVHHPPPHPGLLPQIHNPSIHNQSGPDRDSLDAYVQRTRPARQQRIAASHAPSEYSEYGMEESHARRASPAPSTQVRRHQQPVYHAQPAYAAQPSYGSQQYRHHPPSHAASHASHNAHGNMDRPRNMASYARPQYAMGPGGGAASQAQQQRQPTGGGGGLRLPRIFTKG